MPRKPGPRTKPAGDNEAPDPRVVLQNRRGFLGWLAGACDRSLGAHEFDHGPPGTSHAGREAVWPAHLRLAPTYVRRLCDPKEPVRALPAATIYIVALRMAGRRSSHAVRLARMLAGCSRLDKALRAIAKRVADGTLTPHERALGDLEWALLDASGVVWPTYAIKVAGLGGVSRDGLERDVGWRLERCLADFVPPDLAGNARDKRDVFRQFGWQYGPEVVWTKRELLRAACLASQDRAIAHQHVHDATLAAAGLYLLMHRDHRAVCGPSLLDGVRTIEPSDATSQLLKRLDREGSELKVVPAIEEYWSACDLVEKAQAASVTAEAAAPADDHGADFAWIRVCGEEYLFSTARQRLAVQFLWEARGKPVAEDSIREHLAVGEGIDWRLSYVFRTGGVPHPAWESIIVQEAPRSRMYKLVRT